MEICIKIHSKKESQDEEVKENIRIPLSLRMVIIIKHNRRMSSMVGLLKAMLTTAVMILNVMTDNNFAIQFWIDRFCTRFLQEISTHGQSLKVFQQTQGSERTLFLWCMQVVLISRWLKQTLLFRSRITMLMMLILRISGSKSTTNHSCYLKSRHKDTAKDRFVKLKSIRKRQ